MQFRKWIIKEMSHITLPGGVPIGGKDVEAIDMMFETYPRDYMPYLKLWLNHFAAKLPQSQEWLIFRHFRTSIEAMPPQHKAAILPDFWWDKARVVYSDDSIKEPK